MREIACPTMEKAQETKRALERKGWDVDSNIAQRNGKYIVRVYGIKLLEITRRGIQ